MTSKVQELLKFTYKDVESLASFISQFGDVHLRQPEDRTNYLQLLETCLVCTSKNYSLGKKAVKSFNQTCRQSEIINIAIKRILKNKGRNQNLLTYGFSEPTNNTKSDVSIGFGIERSQLNGCVQMLTNSLWKQLLSRIGDELMLHLLESRSIFVALPGSSYLQVTGLPIYKEVSQENSESSLFKGKMSVSKAAKEINKSIKSAAEAEASRKRKRQNSGDQTNKKRCVLPEKESMDINEVLEYLEDSQEVELPFSLEESPNQINQISELTQPNLPEMKHSKSKRRRERRKKMQKELKVDQLGKCLFTYHTPVLKRSVLYAKDLREKLSMKYMFTDTNESAGSALKVVENILKDVSMNIRNGCQSLNPETGQSVLNDTAQELQPLVLEMIRKHQCCKYRFMLESKCPLNQPVQLTATNANNCTGEVRKSKEAVAQMISRTYTPSQVYLFLRCIILKIIPLELFGCKKNQKLFLKSVETFVKLGKFQKLYQGQLLIGVKLKSVAWLKRSRTPRQKELFYVTVVQALLKNLVIPLITSFFYVTDNAAYRNLLFYYRKTDWRKIHKLGLRELLERKMLCPIGKEAEHNEKTKSLGACILRFLPKLSGVRPILNMAARKFQKRSINMHLSDALQAMSYLTKKQQNIMESSINGVEDIYRKWHTFVMKCRNRRIVKLYFVKVDIQHCYDTIDQKKMMAIVRNIFPKAEEADFLVRRYAAINACGGRLKTMYKQDVTTLDDLEPRFRDFICKAIAETGMHSTIIVDQVYTQVEKSNYFLKKIEAHLRHNLVQVGQDVLLQCTGISQGCVLSSLLCSLYYSEMERKYLEIGPDDLLMRQVDDFLYVTPNLNAAKEFLTTMLNGIPEYNCETHPSKSVTNFPEKERGVQVLPQSALFPWCGLHFNTKTLEIQMQTERYAGMSMRDTMTFNPGLCPGKNLRVKLQQSLRPKFTALLLDPEVNSWECQIINAWKAFLLCAFRCHTCLLSMPNERMNVRFLVDMIGELASFLLRQVSRHLIKDSSKLLSKQIFSWLCFDAFYLKMRQHHGRYFNLSKKLRRRKNQLSKKLGSEVVKRVSSIVGNQLPEEFTLIFD